MNESMGTLIHRQTHRGHTQMYRNVFIKKVARLTNWGKEKKLLKLL